jgi:hypothetical protein
MRNMSRQPSVVAPFSIHAWNLMPIRSWNWRSVAQSVLSANVATPATVIVTLSLVTMLIAAPSRLSWLPKSNVRWPNG